MNVTSKSQIFEEKTTTIITAYTTFHSHLIIEVILVTVKLD